ncbi:uncharacterized protein C11orf42 homolog [Ornithorhynchus anatinus]|nr:uncharacterized protein C11orf42 homolog [Ornithorhynchus anatinus]
MAGASYPLSLGEADAHWTLIKDKVIEECFGPAVVPVPFLEDAVGGYDLLGVLIKRPLPPGGRLLRRGRRRRRLLPVGALPGLLAPAGDEGSPRRGGRGGGGGPGQAFAHCTREASPKGRGEAGYEETRLVGGEPCRISLQLGGLHRKAAFLLLRPGQLALRPGPAWTRGLRSLYLIHEVFCCSWLQLSWAPAARPPGRLRLQRALPLAFSCLKFALGPRGALGPQKVLEDGALRGATWLRLGSPTPPPDPGTSPPGGAAPPASPGPGPSDGPSARLSYRGRNPFRRVPRPPSESWPFNSGRGSRARIPGGSPPDPDRHSMSLPLLRGPSAELDSDD